MMSSAPITLSPRRVLIVLENNPVRDWRAVLFHKVSRESEDAKSLSLARFTPSEKQAPPTLLVADLPPIDPQENDQRARYTDAVYEVVRRAIEWNSGYPPREVARLPKIAAVFEINGELAHMVGLDSATLRYEDNSVVPFHFRGNHLVDGDAIWHRMANETRDQEQARIATQERKQLAELLAKYPDMGKAAP